MQFHGEIWRALDRLAVQHGMTASGLARQAGLDPTTFNKSKRITREGRLRWPSTESVARALAATNRTFGHLVTLVEQPEDGVETHELAVKQLGAPDDAASDAPLRKISFPKLADARAFAVEIGDDSLSPVYLRNDVLIASPAAAVKPGDRVVIGLRDGTLTVRQLLHRNPRTSEFLPLHPRHSAAEIDRRQIEWTARVLWVSQGSPTAA